MQWNLPLQKNYAKQNLFISCFAEFSKEIILHHTSSSLTKFFAKFSKERNEYHNSSSFQQCHGVQLSSINLLALPQVKKWKSATSMRFSPPIHWLALLHIIPTRSSSHAMDNSLASIILSLDWSCIATLEEGRKIPRTWLEAWTIDVRYERHSLFPIVHFVEQSDPRTSTKRTTWWRRDCLWLASTSFLR